MFVLVLFCIAWCLFWFCSRLAGEDRARYFALNVLLLSYISLMGFYAWSLLCSAVFGVLFCFAVVSLGRRELVALLRLSSWCHTCRCWCSVPPPHGNVGWSAARGNTLIFSSCVGSGQASTVHPPKISGLLSTPKNVRNFSNLKKYPSFHRNVL